eukprot:8699501-Heterocapsa_arctica.AAC.1
MGAVASGTAALVQTAGRARIRNALRAVDTFNAEDDHFPVAVTLETAQKATAAACRWRRPTVDLFKVRDP